MEIVRNRYGAERVLEKISDTKIRVMGESLFSRGSEDEDGKQTMFDFEGGPCLNIGGKIKYMGSDFKINSISISFGYIFARIFYMNVIYFIGN